MANRYWVPLKYLVYSDSHLNFKFEGKIKIIAVTYQHPPFTQISTPNWGKSTRSIKGSTLTHWAPSVPPTIGNSLYSASLTPTPTMPSWSACQTTQLRPSQTPCLTIGFASSEPLSKSPWSRMGWHNKKSVKDYRSGLPAPKFRCSLSPTSPTPSWPGSWLAWSTKSLWIGAPNFSPSQYQFWLQCTKLTF